MKLRKTLVGLFTLLLLLSFTLESASTYAFASEQSETGFSTEDLTDTAEKLIEEVTKEELTEALAEKEEKDLAAEKKASKKTVKKQASDEKTEKKKEKKKKKLYTDRQLRLMASIIFVKQVQSHTQESLR